MPVAGDVLSFAETSPSQGGHTAIVTGVSVDADGNGTIDIMDQNNGNDTDGTGTLSVSDWVIGTQSGIGSVTGWLDTRTTVASASLSGETSGQFSGVSSDAANDVWAIGGFYDSSSYREPLIEHWNGAEWSVSQSAPLSGGGTGDYYLKGVKAFSPDNVWAVGYYLDTDYNYQTVIEHWDGSSWTPVTDLPSGQLYAIDGASSDDVWAVGTTPDEYGLTMQHTSSGWAPISNTTSAGTVLNGVSEYSSSDLWAVGTGPYSRPFSMLSTDNGNSWTVEATPNATTSDYGLTSVYAISTNDVYAVGYTSSYTGWVIHWNGSWSTASTISLGSYSGLGSVTAVSSDNIWASGHYTSGGGTHTLIWHSSDGGSTWEQVPSDSPGSTDGLNAITVNKDTGNVWAVGGTYPTQMTEFFN
jgi:hypothetical protein